MNDSLLVSLRKYIPGKKMNPLENFITEAFAWCLNNYADFGKFFLGKVIELLNQKLDDSEKIDASYIPVSEKLIWKTQENINGYLPDMFCEYKDIIFIFEHKAWSKLHGGQLKNYSKAATQKYKDKKSFIILITGGSHLHTQKNNLALCWYNIYELINDFEKDINGDKESYFITKDFQELLKSEGMGPPVMITQEAISGYYPSKDLLENLSSLISRVSIIEWAIKPPEGCKQDIPSKRGQPKGYEWGRLGINLFGDRDFWKPGIFVGFLIDEVDHQVDRIKENSPDCSVIIDIHPSNFDELTASTEYISFLKDLENKINNLTEFKYWEVDSNSKNKWHPILIRKPLISIFDNSGSTSNISDSTLPSQDEIFIKEINRILEIIKDCGFEDLQKKIGELEESKQHDTKN